MADKKPKKAWWINQTRNGPGGITYGDLMPENMPQSRLDELKKVEDIDYKRPEEKEVVTVSQVDSLRIALKKSLKEIEELKKDLKEAPENDSDVKTEIGKLKLELKTFKESAVKSDPVKIQELADAKNKITELETAATKSTEDFNAQFDELADAKKKITELEEKITDPGGK